MKKSKKDIEYVKAYFTYNFKGKKRLARLTVPVFKIPGLEDGWEKIITSKLPFKKVR